MTYTLQGWVLVPNRHSVDAHGSVDIVAHRIHRYVVSVTHGSTHSNLGGGDAAESGSQTAVKQQKKNSKMKQNTRRRGATMVSSDDTQELEDPPAAFKAAVRETIRFRVDHNNDLYRTVPQSTFKVLMNIR